MTSRAKSDRVSLQAHDVYFKKLKDLDSCPTELQGLFKHVIDIQDLKFDYFGGYETTQSDHLISPTNAFSPRQQYERELKYEAYELSTACSDNRRPDDNEEKWVQILGPIVFYRFDREMEENFICRKHYPTRSRPLINRASERGIERRIEKWSNNQEDFCEQTSEHLNLPNFDTVGQLAYPEFENEQKKIPDLTIGLHSYDLNQWEDIPDFMLLHNDKVRLFDQKLLRTLEESGYLTPPFSRPGSHGRSVGDVSLTFPFAFWEAKREGGGYDHQAAGKQNAIKIKMILNWQDEIAKTADVPWVPLVWYFVSIGSKWEIHGCHFQQKQFATDSRICVLIKLWSGDSADDDDALQLLYIIDVIALWGEHKYKPFAGACIRRFQAKLENKSLPPLDQTLFAQQMEIDRNIFSWLFPEPEKTQLPLTLPITSRYKSQELLPGSRSRSPSPQSPQLLSRIEQLSLTSPERDYIIPERDYFIWLLDRGTYDGDLLIVRIDTEGSILPPLVIFDSSSWGRRHFNSVIKEERARQPDGILTDFRVCQDGRSYVKNCVARSSGYFREPETQFIAIIPLDPRTYYQQRHRDIDGIEGTVFARFESLLHLPRLIDDAERANDRWCECEALYNEHSPSMILCDNPKCTMGWYHKKCVGLTEDFTAKCWLCKQCLKNWQGNELSRSGNEKINEEIREASDARIQRTKTLARVWEAHNWPNPEKVRNLIDRTSCRINIKTSAQNTYNTIPELSINRGDESRCWAILRNTPKVMMAVRPFGQDVARGTNKSARRVTHRKSDCGISSVATIAHNLTPIEASSQLSLPRWRHL